MSIFAIFMICWCTGAVLFPAASVISVHEPSHNERKAPEKTKKIEKGELKITAETQTVFLNDFNKKELFVLQGDYSSDQIVEYKGVTYLVYFEKIEGNQIFMCAKNINRKLPEPGLEF